MAVLRLETPLSEADVRGLRTGDRVLLSGPLWTGRDAFHRWVVEGRALPQVDLHGGALYHCGPVVVRGPQGWEVLAAGPTTSARAEPWTPALIRSLGLRAILGKGGMGAGTLEACREQGAVYLVALGGGAQLLAQAIRRVRAVHLLDELGPTEALWELEVQDLPARVTMDSHGRSLHDEVAERSAEALRRLLELQPTRPSGSQR